MFLTHRNRQFGLIYRDPERASGGYTLFSSTHGPHATLVDDEGRIVHRWTHPEGIQYARLLSSGNLLFRSQPPTDGGGLERIGGSSGALFEVDWDGNVVWEYRNPALHHDFERLPNGNHLVVTWRTLPPGVSATIQGGIASEDDPADMLGDVVQEITPAGDVVMEWRSWEHLDVGQDQLCPLDGRREWTHLNSIMVTPAGEWLVSFRLTDTIGLVRPSTGDFTWKWGPGTLSHQHHATWLDNGHVLVFDNGAHRRRGPNFSQVLEVDPATSEVVWTYRAPVLLSFYSYMVSGAERLPNGNTFITEGAFGHLFEVTPEGETVWEYVSGFTYESRAFGPTPMMFRAHRYAADDPRFVGRELDPARHAAATRAHLLGETPY